MERRDIQVSQHILEKLPDTVFPRIDAFRRPRIRTNIRPARIGMHGLNVVINMSLLMLTALWSQSVDTRGATS
jgi:hypothetical protein